MTASKLTLIGNHGGVIDPPPVPHGEDDQDGRGSPDYGQGLRRARLGLLCATISILTLFLVFTGILMLRRGTSTFDERSGSYATNWSKVPLPTGLLLANTIILLISSLTMEMARRRIARDVALSPVRSIPGVSVGKEAGFPWLASTICLGMAFLGGQGMAWRALVRKGFYLTSGASSSFVYLLTAAHAIHLAGGILALLYCSVIYFSHRPVESRHIVVDIVSWYWHFMLFLWIYIFGLLEFVR